MELEQLLDRVAVNLEPTYLKEIQLSRALVRALVESDDKIYLHKESRRAYEDLIAHYKIQMDEGVQ